MTEADMVVAFHSAVDLNVQILFGYVSLMSAFLVMSYLVADKLPGFLAAIVVTLFSVISALLIYRISLNRSDAEALMSKLIERRDAGAPNMDWLGTNPPWSVQLTTLVEIIATIGGFLACIAFFVYQRRAGRREA